jgi:hypothetical protein
MSNQVYCARNKVQGPRRGMTRSRKSSANCADPCKPAALNRQGSTCASFDADQVVMSCCYSANAAGIACHCERGHHARPPPTRQRPQLDRRCSQRVPAAPAGTSHTRHDTCLTLNKNAGCWLRLPPHRWLPGRRMGPPMTHACTCEQACAQSAGMYHSPWWRTPHTQPASAAAQGHHH